MYLASRASFSLVPTCLIQVTYRWRRDEFPNRHFPEGVFAGFLADEVQEIMPGLVNEDGDGWKSLDYSGFVPYLVRAVQDMQQQIDRLEARLAAAKQQAAATAA